MRPATWAKSARAVGEASYGLLQAELTALGDDLKRSGRRLGGVVMLAAGALFTLFWTLGLLLYLAVELLDRWLPRWGAVATVLAAALLLAAVLAWIARRRLERLESPAEAARRRWRSHRDWWESRLEPAAEADDEAAPSGSGG